MSFMTSAELEQVRQIRAETPGVLRHNPTKREGPQNVDQVVSSMSPSTLRKLKPAKVLTCPGCGKQFVEGRWRGRYPQRFCSKNCSRTAWRKRQAAFLEAGRKYVAEYAAQGLNDDRGDDVEIKEIRELFSSFTPTAEEFDQWFDLATARSGSEEELGKCLVRGERSK